MKGLIRAIAMATVLAACGGDGSTGETATDDVELDRGKGSSSSSSEPSEGDVGSAGADMCEEVTIDPSTFGSEIGREGLQFGQIGEADPGFFNVDGLTSCSVRYQDPIQANRNDGYSVWEMPAGSASADQLADGVVSLNPSSLSSETLPSGFIAVRSGDLYLGVAGSNGTTTAYAQINPRLETPDFLIAIVQAALDG